uniref:Uncharacterized protein n=1 Tax=Ananas comosus var. bracteatus TaxID=296719 RepID=A0A6V7PGR7_ANACO|nr:unnamed protein product [Ananas comosus var. bracteatus]
MAVATLSSILRTSSLKALKVSAISVYLSPTFDRMSSNSAMRSSTDAESFVIRVSLPLPRLEGCLEASPQRRQQRPLMTTWLLLEPGSDTNCLFLFVVFVFNLMRGNDDLDLRPWRPRPGPYLGEISALSLLPLPSNLSSFPLLLAGSGSQLLVYAVESGSLLNSFQVFEGVRVHGIAPRFLRSTELLPFSVAVFGERRVKLFALRVGAGDGGAVASVGLELLGRLPGFDHWVLDVRFLEEDELLAVGLSDNSVALWDLKACSLGSRVKSPDRCLLFSMRMCGNSIGSLLVASGTIFNEDSARIWMLSGGTRDCSELEKIPGIRVVTQLSLFGHNARIWDCYISDSTVITAGEDCTCRVWGMEGKQIMMFKEHIGRGIWRCSYDPSSSLLITAGFDSAIKVHQLCSSSTKEKAENNVMPNEFGHLTELFTISPPKVSKQLTDRYNLVKGIECILKEQSLTPTLV